ncbi:MAG TPA: hypothetical protein VFI28_02860 [Candidatus Limnocylindrales bacterium]|nr:hypothetical protein [Candidatus Limnocylindrales bacterium]
MTARPAATRRRGLLPVSWQRLATAAGSAIVAGSVVVLLVSLALSIADGNLAQAPFYLIFILPPATLGFVGALLTTRRPDNAIGWLLLASGMLAGGAFASVQFVDAAIVNGAADAPIIVAMAWIASTWFVPAIGLLVVFLPLIYPSGHLPGGRWRIVAFVGVLGVLSGAIGPATAAGPLSDPNGPLNPLVPPEPLAGWIQAISTASNFVAPPIFLLAVANLLIRFRRSEGVERQQMKWFLFVASFSAVAFIVSLVGITPISDVAWVVGLLSMAFLPLAIGLAILRYRLYDIDGIVSRTIAYTLVTALLGSLFVAIVLASESVLQPLTQSNNVAVAASTLIVASLFRPAVREIQSRVDRRFDRSRVSAERLIAAFGTRLRDETDLPAIDRTLVTVVGETLGPRSIGLWLRAPAATSGSDR